MTLFSATFRPARLGERDAERLEDRLEDVLRVLALDQPHVERQARALGELPEEPGDDVALDARNVGVREVDVRDDERPTGGFERHTGERLVGRDRRRSVPTG